MRKAPEANTATAVSRVSSAGVSVDGVVDERYRVDVAERIHSSEPNSVTGKNHFIVKKLNLNVFSIPMRNNDQADESLPYI